MASSIIQAKTRKPFRECFMCRLEASEHGYYGELEHTGLERHHIMHGHARRQLSEEWGVWTYLCKKHHSNVHDINDGTDRFLKMVGQKRFEQLYGHDKWMEVFGKNYL